MDQEKEGEDEEYKRNVFAIEMISAVFLAKFSLNLNLILVNL